MTKELRLIQEALAETLECNTEFAVHEEMDIANDLELDSIQFMHFLLAIEDRIPGLEFNPEVIGQSEFNKIGNLIEYIRQVSEPKA